MFSGLLIILLPLIVGYLIPLHQASALRLINRFLSWIVYVILFFMGISLAFLDNLATNLLSILHYSAVTVVVILLCNIAALFWLERTIPWKNHHHQEKLPSRIAMALESLKLCGVVVLGFVLGLTGWPFLQHATEASEYTLIFLLFLIGIQLRNNGMTLKQIVLNRRGMIVAVIVVASSMVAGVINALILDLPLKTGLAINVNPVYVTVKFLPCPSIPVWKYQRIQSFTVESISARVPVAGSKFKPLHVVPLPTCCHRDDRGQCWNLPA